MASRQSLDLGRDLQAKIDPYLPQASTAPTSGRPFVTLTYAMSLDSQIAAAPGTQTALSGLESKAMTHYLRTRHDGIAVGAGTAVADDPTLNSRIKSAVGRLDAQPRPIVLDRSARWQVNSDSKVLQAASAGQGKAPWIVVESDTLDRVAASTKADVVANGGSYIPCRTTDLPSVLAVLKHKQIDSIMIEGGAAIINDILSNHLDLVDSVIVTIAPVYLGQGGMVVCPLKNQGSLLAAQFEDVIWITLGADIVMCARPKRSI